MGDRNGKVIEVLSPREVVVNLGEAQGISNGDRVVVFGEGKELIDPDTAENLGKLEILRGRGEVVHTQDKVCTVRSTEKKRVQRDRLRKKLPSAFSGIADLVSPLEYVPEEVDIDAPFESVRVGDSARIRR